MKHLHFQVVRDDGGFENVDMALSDVERLMGELALFGKDEETQRARAIARVLYEAINQEETIAIRLDAEHRVFVALDRIGQRSGLSDPMAELRRICAPVQG